MEKSSNEQPETAEPPFRRDLPTFAVTDWDNGSWSIQRWLERTAWKTLRDTEYGRAKRETGILPDLFSDPLLQQVYLIDVAIFIGGERTSIEAVAGLLRCAPDDASRTYLGTQVLDECRHYEVFCRRMADFGITPEKRDTLVKRYTTPAVRKFYDLILEQVDRGDFVAGSLAQNVIMEGMAYPLYRYEIKYWSKIDPSLSQIIKGAFADEAHHVGFGEAFMRHHVAQLDPGRRDALAKLIRQFSGLMTEAFEQVIHHYVGLYQECADQYIEVMGDVEIFPGRKMATINEEEQVRVLMSEIAREYRDRANKIGLG